MFTDKIEAADFSRMPEEYRTLLGRVLRIQADCEIGGPHLYVDQWLLSAPSVLGPKYGCCISDRNGIGFGGATPSQCSSLRDGATPKTAPFRPNP